eukprot:COSAG01_NODE_2757_length_7128_cov_12.179542_1_plen_437_part_00
MHPPPGMGCGASSPTGIRPAREMPSHADELSRMITQLREGSTDARAQAAGELANHLALHREDTNQMAAVVRAGAVPLLIKLLHEGSQWHAWHATASMRALACLARHPDNQVEIVRAGAVPPLIALLHSAVREQHPRLVTACNIGSIIGNLACHTDNQTAIAEAGAVPPLIKLLSLDPAGQDIRLEVPTAKAQRFAAIALANLAQANADNQVAIANAGAIPPLLALYMRERLQPEHGNAVGALATLAQNADIQATIMAQCQQMGLDGLDIPEGLFSAEAEASRLEIRPAEGAASSPIAPITTPPVESEEQQQLEAAIQLSWASASAEKQARSQLAEQESRVLRESLSASTPAPPATQPPPPPPPPPPQLAAAAAAAADGTALAQSAMHAALASRQPEHELTDCMALGFARQRALREKQHALEAQLRALVAEDPAAAL